MSNPTPTPAPRVDAEALALSLRMHALPTHCEQVRALARERDELVEALWETARALEFVLAGEDARPAKWLIPGGRVREDAVTRARTLLARHRKDGAT